MTIDLNALIARLPKAELHVHLEGTLEPEMMFALAYKNKVTLPYENVDALRAAYRFDDLQSFLNLYYAGASVLCDADDFYALTWAYLQRAHIDRVVHTEIFIDPQTHTSRGVALSAVFEGVVEALRDGQAILGITWRLIPNFLRHLSEEEAIACFEACAPFLDTIDGFGLDSSEIGHPPAKFQRLFGRIRAQGIPVVAHAGEEGPAQYVRDAIELLRVSRIDHGIRAIDDPALVAELALRKIALTVCPLSNLKLKATPDLTQHPLLKLFDAGVLVTINSDDPAYFGGYINDNYLAIANALNIPAAQVRKLAANSIEASWLDDETKAEHLAAIEIA